MPVPLWNDEAYDVGGLPTGSATVLDDGQVRIVYPGGCNCNFPSCKWSCQVSPGSGSGPNGEHGGGTYAVAEPENTSDPLMTRWCKPSYNPVFPSSTERNDANQIFADSSSAWKTAHGEWRFVGVNPNYTVAAPLKPPAGCENAPGCNMSPLFGSTDGFQSFKLIGYQENFTAGECPSLFPVRALYYLTVSFFVHSRPMCQSSLHHASSLTSSPSARLAAWRIMPLYVNVTMYLQLPRSVPGAAPAPPGSPVPNIVYKAGATAGKNYGHDIFKVGIHSDGKPGELGSFVPLGSQTLDTVPKRTCEWTPYYL
jgi:hypothetical protein